MVAGQHDKESSRRAAVSPTMTPPAPPYERCGMQRNSFWRLDFDSRVFVGICFWIVVMTILGLASGCKTGPKDGDVKRASGELPTMLDTISKNAQRLKPHADATGQAFAQAIAEDAAAAKVPAQTITDGYHARTAELGKLKNDPWVKAAIWIKRLFYTLIISWFVLGIASVFFGVSNPLGWTWKIGVFIRRLMPLSNPFGKLNDVLRNRSKSSTSTLKPKRK